MIILLALFFVSSNVLSQDFFDRTSPASFSKLQGITAGRTLAGYPLPSGDFEWKILGITKNSSTGGGVGADVEIGEVILADIRGKNLRAALVIRGNLFQSRMGDWTTEPCKRDDLLWKSSKGGKFSNQNCATINHRVNFFKAPTGLYQQILTDLRSVDLDIPPTVLTVEFTRYGSGGRYLVYRFEVNPEYFGVARDNETVWGASSWYKDRVQTDPAKAAFIDGLGRWASDFQGKMDDAFSKKSEAFGNIKSLESYLTLQDNKVIPKSLTLATRLERIKDLRDKNLITQGQYDQEVARVLSGY